MNEKNSQKLIDEKLALLKYKTSENSHIEINQELCKLCKNKPCLTVCPARVYVEEENLIKVNYENCLECGCCKIACEKKSIKWNLPTSGHGVIYKYS